MAYDEKLAARLRDVFEGRKDVVEKHMFGGVAFMVRGNMAVGIIKDDLMVRVGPEGDEAALKQPHVRPMDFVGRPMAGYVYVAPAGCKTAASLKKWVSLGVEYATSLPEKKQKPPKPVKKKAR